MRERKIKKTIITMIKIIKVKFLLNLDDDDDDNNNFNDGMRIPLHPRLRLKF